MDFLGGSFKIGRMFGIDIRVHMIMVIWIAFQLFSGGDMRWTLTFLTMLFGIVLIHEFGHCFGARSVGGDAANILLWPLGGLAFAHAPMRPWPQFVTVVCGPLVNVVFCILSGAILTYYDQGLDWFRWSPFAGLPAVFGPSWLFYVRVFYFVNYMLLTFNLLPIYPLDGGQILQTILWPFMGLRESTMLACQIGIAGAMVGAAWSLRNQDTMLIFVALFVGWSCWQRYQAAKHGMLIEDRDYRVYRPGERAGFLGKFFKRKPKPTANTSRRSPANNPNPGGWERKQEQERSLDAEMDRILKKVHEQGIQSLSYIEQQTLERATRAQQEREKKLEQQFRK
ncbi:MAG: site-2 protease family protein [Phycisphaerae bacterium]